MWLTTWLRKWTSPHARRRQSQPALIRRPRIEALGERLCPSGVSFGPPITWSSGPASAVTVGDFNGDGNADLGVANYGGATDSVSALFGNGGGEFAAPRLFVVGPGAFDVASADFNGDGFDDLAVARQLRNNVTVLLGDASGNLTPSYSLDTTLPWSVVAGDFNRDGKSDLAFGTENTRKLNVLLGDGSGGFGTPATFPVSAGYSVVAVGDFNGDGLADLASSTTRFNGGSTDLFVDVLVGDGTGNFGNAPPIQLAAESSWVAVADFNGDGFDDLATSGGPNTVSVRFSEGTGAFTAPVDLTVLGAPSSASVADFDGDGNPDLAVTTSRLVGSTRETSVSVLLGDGRGGFAPKVDFPLGLTYLSGFGASAVGDFNNDGKPDLAAGESYYDSGTGTSAGRVSVLLNTTPVNQAPVIADQVFAVAENTAAGAVVGTAAASDPDAGQKLSYQITAGNAGGAFAVNASTGQITIANGAALDYETTPVFTLTVQVTDDGAPALSSTATITINLGNVNEAPVNSVPSYPQAVTKNKALTFSRANGNAISIADPDGRLAVIQVTLTVQHGRLTLAGTAGLSFLAGDGRSDGTMTFRGTVADINAALDGLTYAPEKGYVGPDALTITTDDLGSGLGGSLIDTDVVSLLVQNQKKKKQGR